MPLSGDLKLNQVELEGRKLCQVLGNYQRENLVFCLQWLIFIIACTDFSYRFPALTHNSLTPLLKKQTIKFLCHSHHPTHLLKWQLQEVLPKSHFLKYVRILYTPYFGGWSAALQTPSVSRVSDLLSAIKTSTSLCFTSIC